mmetsp:Transcript_226/g.614  ORF Transcript_226/g.614 Transcript_226/m.614 type:complete len:206 (+) Transcript_226:144-761(+)
MCRHHTMYGTQKGTFQQVTCAHTFSSFSRTGGAALSDGREGGNRERNGKGIRHDKQQTVTSGARFVKSSLVTPNAFVRAEPSAVPVKDPPLSSDISAAYSVASTPSGQSCVASTSIGMKDTWPSTVSSSESPKTKRWSSSPHSLLRPVMRMRSVRPKLADSSVVQRNIFFSGTSFSSVLYNATPPSEAMLPTSWTRPRNSGEKCK